MENWQNRRTPEWPDFVPFRLLIELVSSSRRELSVTLKCIFKSRIWSPRLSEFYWVNQCPIRFGMESLDRCPISTSVTTHLWTWVIFTRTFVPSYSDSKKGMNVPYSSVFLFVDLSGERPNKPHSILSCSSPTSLYRHYRIWGWVSSYRTGKGNSTS